MTSLLDLLQKEKSFINRIEKLSKSKVPADFEELQVVWQKLNDCRDEISNYLSNNITHDIFY